MSPTLINVILARAHRALTKPQLTAYDRSAIRRAAELLISNGEAREQAAFRTGHGY